MFGKKDMVDNLSQDLDRARARRDTLASGVTTLTAEIAQLEARLSEEKDRRERARAIAEIDQVTHQLTDAVRTFAPAVARLRDATAAAGTVVAKAGDLSGFLDAFAAEVSGELEAVLSELRRCAEVARTGEPPVQPSPPSEPAPRPPHHDPMLLGPVFLRRKQEPQVEPTDDRRTSAA
jgi:outer membrane murein-binding lipoprotein Lpp